MVLRIGVLAYPGCFASEVYGVPDLLVIAAHAAIARGPRGPSIEICVLSPRRHVRAAGGVAIDVAGLRKVDVLVVPGFELGAGVDFAETLSGLGPEIGAIKMQAKSGTDIVSICIGAFLVAEAGLLDGFEATTSWLYADQLARRYPRVSVRADRLVITDHGVTTTGGFSAMYDFALALIRQHYGSAVARTTARVALVDDARSTQTPYVDEDLMSRDEQAFSAQVRRQLNAQLATPYKLAEVASSAHVSPRTLLRRFRDETGQTPLGYLQSARVTRARELLETTDRTVASIAAEVGYADVSTFRTLFARHAGRRPGDYRATFRRPPEASSSGEPGRH